MVDYSPSSVPELSLENTLRHQTNTKSKHERTKRIPHRKYNKDNKYRYSIDDMRLSTSSMRDSHYDMPSRAVSHADTLISPSNEFYVTMEQQNPRIYFTAHSSHDQEPISDDNISNQTPNDTSETDFTHNSKFTELLMKPKNVFKESDAYRHLTRMIRPRGNIRGNLANSDSEKGSDRNSFIPSGTNSDEDLSHYRFMQNRNLHNMVYHSQDKEKFLDSIKSDLERVKGEFREVKGFHSQLGKSVEDVEGKLNDFQHRILTIELMITDFTEMHQNEVQELKQQLAQIQYDSVARVQDLEEGQDALQRKIIELEVRTNMQESASQLFAPNGGGFFRSLLFKVLNVIILLLSIFAMTMVKLFSQFSENRFRSTLSFIITILTLYLTYNIYYHRLQFFDWIMLFKTDW